jgi:gluconate 5-dehydrogenase
MTRVDPFRVDGLVALVTGAATGIGAAVAQALANAGADVACHGNTRPADATCEAIRKAGRRAISLGADLADKGRAGALVQSTLKEFGRVDILVNNAGLTWGEAPETMPLDKWHKVIDANLTGAFLFSQAAGRIMLQQEYGRIINIASVAGLQGSVNGPHYVGYAASKAGLMGLTRELAASWGRRGIRVNAIAPGFFHSRLADAAIPMAEPGIKAFSPIPRVGAVGELKGVAVFLAADASNYITGQVIVVDGGRTIA